ncbi:MAG: (d)CMP kinase [Desulfobacteraceae bacterium]|nr:(d)CMP kinase [Desulfobacteraceae bacterium]
MLPDKAIVTIDGPSGAGKSTISRGLAARLGYTYLDTGAMYRAVGLSLERQGVALDRDEETLARRLAAVELRLAPNEGADVQVFLNGEDVSTAIRTPEMGMVASRVSAHPLVRRTLTELQRRLGAPGRIVAEGRDMGTVVFPGAEFKFYLDAAAEVRARRRCEQLRAQGQPVAYEEILAQIVKRDRDDSARALAPLKPAADAVIIDSSGLDIAGVIGAMMENIARQREGKT